MQDKPLTKNQFPPLESALVDPNGLLATGGDLSCERLQQAYSLGIFPWFSDGQPIMWWSPDPRAVMYPHKLHLSKSLKKNMRQKNYQLSVNRDFEQVIYACAESRTSTSDETLDDTWITNEMIEAYVALHHNQQAHSFEVWDGNALIGGLYGVATGRIFSGESMFHRRTDASKMAFALTCMQIKQWGFELLDCQIMNPHLKSLGVEELPRASFKKYLPSYSHTLMSVNNINAWQTSSWKNTHDLSNAFTDTKEGAR